MTTYEIVTAAGSGETSWREFFEAYVLTPGFEVEYLPDLVKETLEAKR